MNDSLRRRISTWLSTSILIGGLLAAVVSFALTFRIATASQDAQLDQFAAVLATRPFERIASRHLPQDIEEAETRFVVAALESPPDVHDEGVRLFFPSSLVDGLQTAEIAGKRWRVMVVRDPDGTRFAVGQTIEARIETALSSALLVLLPLALLIPMLLLALRWALARAFMPLHALSQEADRIDGSSVTRLASQSVAVELRPFVQAVNRLLDRLGLALDQQRKLVSNAAHELRSPIHALMIQAENVRAVPLSAEAALRVEALEQGLERTTQLLDQLLGLARVQGPLHRRIDDIALHEVLRQAIATVLPLATAKDIDLGCLRLDDTVVRGTPDDAFLLMRNAIDNAVRYTPRGGRVDLSLVSGDGAMVFEVADTGPGIAAADRERVFEPFVRVIGTQETGSGLGLSIAKAAAEALGGTIELQGRTAPASGLRFIYRQTVAVVPRPPGSRPSPEAGRQLLAG